MNIPELKAFLRTFPAQQSMIEMLAKVNDYQLAKIFVDERVPDIHVVHTFQKADKKKSVTKDRWIAGLVYSVISLDKRGLIAVSAATAPQQLGRSFAYDDAKHPYYVWAMDAYLSAAAYLKALEVVQGAA